MDGVDVGLKGESGITPKTLACRDESIVVPLMLAEKLGRGNLGEEIYFSIVNSFSRTTEFDWSLWLKSPFLLP